jgi:microcin C transport system ATP-binding protein
MLFITHNLSIVRQLADTRRGDAERTAALSRIGCRTLLISRQHPYTRSLLDSEPAGLPVPLPRRCAGAARVDQLRVAFPFVGDCLRRGGDITGG